MASFAFCLLTWFQAVVSSSAETTADSLGCVEVQNAVAAYREAVHYQRALTGAEADDPHQSCERPLRADARGVPAGGTLAIEADRLPDFRSGVGIMLLNQHDDIFVGRRTRTPGGTWQMPQGGIDDGEKPLAAALRELREETGTDNIQVLAESETWLRYELPPDLIGKAWQGRWRGQQQKWFAMRYLGRDADINIATEHPEFSAWRWVPAPGLPNLIVSFKRQVYLDVLEQFRTVGSAGPAPGRPRRARIATNADLDPDGHRPG